jgi:octaprenyl-diphosphate synthase
MLSELSVLSFSVRTELFSVEKEIRKQVDSNQALLRSMNQDWFSAKGKLLRSLLVLWCSCNKNKKIPLQAIKTASVMELLHQATLIHDDIIDQAPLRRGKATFHKSWGAPSAVLYGDYLISMALQSALSIKERAVLEILSQAASQVCQGEILQNHHAFDPTLTRKAYLHIIHYKTASLFSACCQAGGILNVQNKAALPLLKQFGLHLGLAYQIMDDCFDFIKNASIKSPFNDLREGKITLPIILLLEKAPIHIRKKIIPSLFETNLNTTSLLSLFKKNHCLQNALSTARKYLSKAQHCAESLDHLHYQKELLGLIALLKKDCEMF